MLEFFETDSEAWKITMDLILYHNNCPDGWCAAYICKKRYPEAALMGLNHGLPESELESLFSFCEGKNVIMVDYSLRTRELNDRLNSVANSFRILDHHKTALAVLDGAAYATFDMKRSGAGLAWDYLFGKDSPEFNAGQTMVDPFKDYRPWWVNYTEDQDLWNRVLPRTHEVNAFLMVQPRTAEHWDEITNPEKMEVTAAVRQGIGVRAYIEYYTNNVVADVQEGVLRFQTGTIESEDGTITLPTYADYRTGVLNIPYTGVSEAGARLNDMGYDIGLAWFERGDGITQFSLRSQKGSNVDVSAIAKSYGGGGHATAAGFQVSTEKGREIVDWVLGRGKYVATSRCC